MLKFRKKSHQEVLDNIPNHIGIIMDGNGRWAKKRLLPRTAGHLAGVKRIKEIVDECFLTYQIPYVSLFCFSSEN